MSHIYGVDDIDWDMDLELEESIQDIFPSIFKASFFGPKLYAEKVLPFWLPFKLAVEYAPEKVSVIYYLKVVEDCTLTIPIDMRRSILTDNVECAIRDAAPVVYFMDPRKGLTVSKFYNFPAFAHQQGLDIVMASSLITGMSSGITCSVCNQRLERTDARWGTGLFLWVHNACYREIEFCLYNAE